MDLIKPVCIVGGGYYGCHLAMCCLKWNIPFHLFEKSSQLFTKSSRWNQNRLHLGFHYARSHKTRVLCKEGYAEFIKVYGHTTQSVPHNYYCVSDESLLDGPTYQCIMDAMDLSYTRVDLPEVCGVTDTFMTDERFIDPCKAYDYFWRHLKPFVTLNANVTHEFLAARNSMYSHVFDCTSNHLFPSPIHLYEQTVSFVYKEKAPAALRGYPLQGRHLRGYTFVDGNCGSLYPHNVEDQLYTLTHVEHTPIQKVRTISALQPVTPNDLDARRCAMEAYICRHLPNFANEFEYKTHFLSLKCKPAQSACDARSCDIANFQWNGMPVTRVVCGKITGIFQFERHVQKILGIEEDK